MTQDSQFATLRDFQKLFKSYGEEHLNTHRPYLKEVENFPFQIDLPLPNRFRLMRGSIVEQIPDRRGCQEPEGKYLLFITPEKEAVKEESFEPGGALQGVLATAEAPTFMDGSTVNWFPHSFRYPFCKITVYLTINGTRVLLAMPVGVAESLFGLEFTDDFGFQLSNGAKGSFPRWRQVLRKLYSNGLEDYPFAWTLETMVSLNEQITFGAKNRIRLLRGLMQKQWPVPAVTTSGIAKTWKKIEPIMAQLFQEDPLTACALRSLANASGRTVNGVKISTLFNGLLKEVKTTEDIIIALAPLRKLASIAQRYGCHYGFDEAIPDLAGYTEKRKRVLKNQGGRAVVKLMEGKESLRFAPEKYPLTHQAIEASRIPLSAFFSKREQYFLSNDNWLLWEEMFRRVHGDIAVELANTVSSRTTYEKDLMSYFAFILYTLPEYLEKHTGEKWTCIPRLVDSASELAPPSGDDTGIARERSALTLIVDNEAKTVTVPYAALQISGGFGTTYCYAHDYHVLTRGFSFQGNVVINEVETKLNGRDDYGLMFYTLTGSSQGRGYPTFLIIFERREKSGNTHVHFHRVHPSRSKDRDYNPIHNWIRVCYNWMAGNVNRDRIKIQQGDLAFVRIKTDPSEESLDGPVVTGLPFDETVNVFDNHRFAKSVKFAPYTKKEKSNILGYVHLEEDTMLLHNEHDDQVIPKGTYAIHQARSWEANPKGVWTLSID